MSIIILEHASDVERDESGVPFAWQSGEEIARFDDGEKFLDYVRDHIKDLRDAVAFSGSASTLHTANAYLADQLKKAELL